MRQDVLDFTFGPKRLVAATAPATSNPLHILDYWNGVIQANGTNEGVAYDVEVSLDGGTWHKDARGMDSSAFSTVFPSAVWARIVLTAITAGSVGFKFSGFHARSDG